MAKNDVRFYVRVDDKYVQTDLKTAHEKIEKSAKSTNDAVVKDTEKSNKKVTQSYKSEGEEIVKNAEDTGSKVSSSASKVGSSLLGVGKGVTAGIGSALAAVGAAAVGIGVSAVSSAVDMDKAMNQFISSTGKGAEEADRYQGVLEGIYANNYGEDFQDIADSMALVTKSMGDMDDASLQSITESAFALQDVFGFDISESVRSAQMMVDQFGISGESAFNLIAQGAQAGLDKNGDFLDSINEYSVQFAQLGLDATDMFNIFNAGAQSGAISIDKVGDAVKELGITVKDGTATDALEALGLNAEETAAAFARGGKDAFYAFLDVNEALSALEDPLQQNTLGVQLYGSMWEDLGAEAVTALANYGDAFNGMNDTMGEIKKVKYDDLGSMFEALTRSVEMLLLPLGEELIPVLNDVIQSIMPALQEVLPPVIEQFGEFFKLLAPLVAEILPVLIELFESLMPPLMDLMEAVLPTIIDLISTLIPIVSDILEAILPVLIELINTLLPPIMEIISALLPPLLELLNALMPIFQTIISLLQPIIDLFMSLLQPIVDLISTAIKPLIEALQPLIDLISQILTPVIEALRPLFENVFGAIFGAVSGVIDSITQIFGGIIDFITGVFTGNWEQAWDGIVNIFKGIFNGIASVVEGVVNTVIGIINGLISGINTVTGLIGIPEIPSIPEFHMTRLKIGLDYVPNDFFPAYLDEGERVLTREENMRFNALGGLPGIEAAMSGYGMTGGNPSFAITLTGDVYMDNRRVGSMVLQSIDSVVKSNGG